MKRFLLSAAIAALIAPNAFGQAYQNPDCFEEDCTLSFSKTGNEVISVGTRIGASQLSELTSAASIITEADIDARNQNYITDILRSLPGIAVSNSGPSANLSQIRIRGNEANQVLVLIDGVEANNPLTGEFDFGGLQTANIARVEILRGEQSALWGADAIGGVINIITKSGETTKHFNASIEAGTFNTVQGQVSSVIPLGGAALSINGNVFSSDNYDISDNDGEKDSSESRSLNIGVNNINFGTITFGAKAGLSRIDTSFEAQVNGRLQDTLADQSTRNIESFRLNSTFELFGFDNLITASSHQEKNNSTFTVVDFSFVTFLEEIAVNPDNGLSLTSLLDTTGERKSLNWAAKKNWGEHNFTILGELENESFEQNSTNRNGLQTQREDDTNSQAIALDYNYNNNNITLNGSARQDFNNLFEDVFTWKIGAGYNLSNIGLGRIRASLGTGVKNPTLTEVFGILSSNTFAGNPNLEPEKSIGFNIGYSQSLFDDVLSFSVDYFHSELENEIFTEFNQFNTPSAPDRANNRDLKSTREGVEIELTANISENLSLRGAATFLDAEFINSFPVELREAPRRPDFITSATAQWTPTEKLSFTGSIDHTGEQLDTDFGSFSTITLDAYTLIGLNAAYDIDDHFTLTLRGDNLLDEDYQEVFGFTSPGRAVYAGLKANF